MSTSEARREANRRNAQRSTGPKTAEGKARSRQNALTHGLTATVVDPELEPSTPQPTEAGPTWHDWLAGQLGRVRVQLDRTQRIEAKLRHLAAWRADVLWDADRQVDAEDLGARLRAEPARTVARLRATPHGCDWLIGRWVALARAAELNKTWDEGQLRLAFDLLGTPAEGRVGFPGGTVDPALDEGQSSLVLARGAIADLTEQRLDAAEADELDQHLAAEDLRDTPTPELARLRRYELALHKRLQWLVAELRGANLGVSTATDPIIPPARNEPNEPAPAADTKPIAAESRPTLASEPTPMPPRDRPDLARLAQRDRRDRRKAGRRHRSA